MTLTELGAALKEAREREGLLEAEIADRLKIPVPIVCAIESGNMEDIPHRVYVRGFIKAYAAMMNFSSVDVLNVLGDYGREIEFKNTSTSFVETYNVHRTVSSGSNIFRYVFVAIIIVLIVCGVFAFRNVFTSLFSEQSSSDAAVQSSSTLSDVGKTSGVIDLTQFLSSDDSAIASKSDFSESQSVNLNISSSGMGIPTTEYTPANGQLRELADKGKISSSAATDTTVKSMNDISSSDVNVNTAELVGASAQSVVLVPQSEIAKNTPIKIDADPVKKHVIELTALENTWCSFRPQRGSRRDIKLRKGETATYAFDVPVVLRLGNAGGVRIRYNGTLQPIAGQLGDVRNLSFPH